MRGVYRCWRLRRVRFWGSSPHARGLPTVRPSSAVPVRIIPACAGFTAARPCARARSPDHPRMRGVYPAAENVDYFFYGSSPHARGLHLPVLLAEYGEGIIPACAGFTRWPGASSLWPGDHPRMRGVYVDATAHQLRHRGSSPHARGLPCPPTSRILTRRIIPACAGFTGLGVFGASEVGDHPRMRGVYAYWEVSCGAARGSSPHARGLHHPQ